MFFDSETFDYRLVASSEGGAIINGPYVGKFATFQARRSFCQSEGRVLHEGRYFLVNDPTDKENMSKIVERFLLRRGSELQRSSAESHNGAGGLAFRRSVHFRSGHQPILYGHQKVNYTDLELQAAIANAQSVATALGNQSQSIAIVTPSSFDAYSSIILRRDHFTRWARNEGCNQPDERNVDQKSITIQRRTSMPSILKLVRLPCFRMLSMGE